MLAIAQISASHKGEQMSLLRVSLFGYARVVLGEGTQELPVTRTGQGLLAFLMLNRHRAHSRDALCGLFWGDYTNEQAKACLNTALWRLRRLIEPGEAVRGAYLLTNISGDIGFNAQGDYWLDVAVFEDAMKRVLARPATALTEADAQLAESAASLYTGDLLDGAHDDWVLSERERLRCLLLNGLTHVMGFCRTHKLPERGLECGRRILQMDPLREDVHREMMRLHHLAGQRSLALQQYDACRIALSKELGIAPMPETQALQAEIAAQAAQTLHTHPQPHHADDAAPRLEEALNALRVAQEQLYQAMRFISKAARSDGLLDDG
jgi:DNA-binding SARP family transcriptional activator